MVGHGVGGRTELTAAPVRAGLDWAAAALRAPVTGVTRLTGGLTSTMLALVDATGRRSVLRLMTEEPWRTHGPGLTAREADTLGVLADTPVPAPRSLALDADGDAAGVSAHLMTMLPGGPANSLDLAAVEVMAEMLATIHAVDPPEPFRRYQSWAPEAKWVVPDWTRHPDSWRRAFALLAEGPPTYEPTFLHRDHSHRNLLWRDGAICGVVDWVETSSGPAWLDAAHAATNLAVGHHADLARAFLAAYRERAATPYQHHWLVLDAVGFLPPPGKPPLFGSAAELARLDDWLHHVIEAADR